ncbi:MAG: D-alanyl-D-alanine carboxypeptidase DacC [Nitrospinaceae bacterium]|nr:MAG: D-alanyl-D-alanine carboxypeptidase DacC [Nitrospinaceae bacterium]
MKGHDIKKKYLFPLVIITVLLFPLSPSQAEPEIGKVRGFHQAVEKILTHPCLKKKNYGVEIFSLDRHEILFQVRKDKKFIPASNLKLITTAAALKHLGPDYRFSTRLFTTGRLEGDTLYGDLYIKGYGDPKLVTEQMWLLVNELENLPLRKIVGNIIADDSYFDSILRVKTWEQPGGAEAYNAPLGALSFNFNTVTVYVSPGDGSGDKPRIIVEPDTQYLKINNRTRTLPNGKRGRLTVHRMDRGDYDEISITGKISKSRPRARYFVNITDPTKYTVSVFKEYLARVGIQFVGETVLGTVPKGARLLVNHKSEPLALALRGLNKFSNNFVAEQIVKTMAAEQFGPPGTTEKGLKIIHQYMQSLGFQAGRFKIVDGSGLSRQNRLTANQIVKVLDDVREDLSIFPEFISALGVMGVDGNVRKRMNGVEESQKARVKTGTLNSVSSLSGYFQSLDGERFAFSILMNDLKCHNGQALKIQDRIVREGLRFNRGNKIQDKRSRP